MVLLVRRPRLRAGGPGCSRFGANAHTVGGCHANPTWSRFTGCIDSTGNAGCHSSARGDRPGSDTPRLTRRGGERGTFCPIAKAGAAA